MAVFTVVVVFACFYSLKVHEILSALECEDEYVDTERVIYDEPPIGQSGQVTDEDSDKSDEEHDGDLNHLGRKLLQSGCELRRFQANRDDALPSTSLGLPSLQVEVLQVNSSSEESDDEDNEPLSHV